MIVFIGLATAVSAQTAVSVPATAPANSISPATARPQMARVIFDVPSLSSEEQYLKIKPILEAVAGVRFVNANLNNHQLVCSYDLEQVNAAKLADILTQNSLNNTINITSESTMPAVKK